MKLSTKFSLLIDCQRRARQLSDALRTATAQVLISVKSGSDVCILRHHVKQWTTVKHELLKNLQGQEKEVERSRFVKCSFVYSSLKWLANEYSSFVGSAVTYR